MHVSLVLPEQAVDLALPQEMADGVSLFKVSNLLLTMSCSVLSLAAYLQHAVCVSVPRS